MMAITTMSPAIISLLESSFISHINSAFAVVSIYASHLFYMIAVIELVLFGISFALKKDDALAQLIMKLFKLAVIFTLISLYPVLLQSLIDGFTFVAFQATPDQAANLLFNPSGIFKYGFDVGADLLKLAVQYGSYNSAMASIYEVLGFGILILLTVIAAQIILVVVGFYLISLLALLILPIGAFTPAKNFFEKALQSVFAAGARVFTLIVVIGISASLWSGLPTTEINQSTNLMIPLGWLVGLVVVAILAIFLPRLAGQTIGHLSTSLWPTSAQTVSIQSPSSPVVVSSPATNQVMAGSTIGSSPAGMTQPASTAMAATTVPGQTAASAASTQSINVSGSKPASGRRASRVGAGAEVKVSISKETLSRLKSTIGSAFKNSRNK